MLHPRFTKRTSVKEKLGADFFADLPTAPGIYRIFNKNGDLLYVGKAKSLRSRLFQYKNANRKNSSRKVLRMLAMADRIEFEICESEEAALLLENKTLRELKPVFNIVNKRPELYRYLRVRALDGQIEFELLGKIKNEDGLRVKYFGAFKARRLTRDAFAALQRLLIFIRDRPESLSEKYFRENIRRFSITYSSSTSFDDWLELLDKFLTGESEKFTRSFERLVEVSSISKYTLHLLNEDLLVLKEFFRTGPRRNWILFQQLNLNSYLIEQTQLDDYIVQKSFSEFQI